MEIINQIDFAILDFLQSIHCEWLNAVMRFFTFLGDKGLIWIGITIVLLVIPKTRKIGACVAAALVVETVLNEFVIKEIIQRQRPFVQNTAIDTIINHPSGYSFPSSHSASSFAAATAIFLYDRRKGSLAFVLAFFIAVSRIYFAVHFPTDIVVGALVGILVAVLTNKLLRFCAKKREEKIINKKAGL